MPGAELRRQLAEFLRARRARVSPGDVGLPPGDRRRTPGLRRQELAQLAGLSVDTYTRVEQGRGSRASREVLDALARALRLGHDEHVHLLSLGGYGVPLPAATAPVGPPVVPAATRQLLDLLVTTPALVLDDRMDVLAWTTLAAALFTDFGELPRAQRNMVRFTFLDPTARGLHREDWEDVATGWLAVLRLAVGQTPDDARLTGLVGELSVKSDDFCRLWQHHDVQEKRRGRKVLHHPSVGRLELDFEALLLPGDPHGRLLVYTAPAASPSRQALDLLGVIGPDPDLTRTAGQPPRESGES